MTNYPESVACGCGSESSGRTGPSLSLAQTHKCAQMLTHIRTHKPGKLTLLPEGLERELLTHLGFLSFWYSGLLGMHVCVSVHARVCVCLHALPHSFNGLCFEIQKIKPSVLCFISWGCFVKVRKMNEH